MLQYLKATNRVAKLLSGLQILQGQAKRRFHTAQSFRALGRQGPAALILQGRQGSTGLPQQVIRLDIDIVQHQITGAWAIDTGIPDSPDSFGIRIDHKQA